MYYAVRSAQELSFEWNRDRPKAEMRIETFKNAIYDGYISGGRGKGVYQAPAGPFPTLCAHSSEKLEIHVDAATFRDGKKHPRYSGR